MKSIVLTNAVDYKYELSTWTDAETQQQSLREIDKLLAELGIGMTAAVGPGWAIVAGEDDPQALLDVVSRLGGTVEHLGIDVQHST